MDPIITSLSTSSDTFHNNNLNETDQSPTAIGGASFYYKKVNVPLNYPSEAISAPKTYVYPPLMSPSDEYFSPQQHSDATSPTTTYPPQPINIPQSQGQRQWGRSNSRSNARRNSLPVKPFSSTPMVKPGSMPTHPELDSYMPSPPTSPWKDARVNGNKFTKPARSATTTTLILDETPYPDLPSDVRSWTSSHVAEYLAYTLRLYPRAITEDLGRYFRQSANLTGAQFIDLREEDLERMQINLKWRSMILKAVGMLRRETLRASRIDEMNWEDGYDPEKDGPMPMPMTVPASSSSSSDEDSSHSIPHTPSTTTEPEATYSLDQLSTTTTIISTSDMADPKQVSTAEHDRSTPVIDPQELRRGIVEDITSVLLSWKKDQEERTKKAQAKSNGGLGFMEGVVIGGLIVAFMMRFSR
ncbi:hypothetical protein BX616_001173 [Lobosporangium transversale]|uniref:SAM domain-containing protein n=1 Tax=Lobosporangium transversale TaxID=64571 RepID=A0A1Y2GS80_9FUNG|nr:hypothetical protein BCR41DRAFT_353535 [Lobosporangium transversale]KAF9919122.1 hypothetical protein BX616_001173 [Lobosporangium transversale]ORZ16113.1 hypothetical protein BCR41DRAFT_353535 [Lobosporangium transversale]|eukprot:XP_021881460.1 hypothetical protein BCR41DRAFT_353535 [Lobosporangium transversale]